MHSFNLRITSVCYMYMYMLCGLSYFVWLARYTCIHMYMKKNISGGARQAILRSLDSAVSSLLALISREYAQLVQHTTSLYTEGAPER